MTLEPLTVEIAHASDQQIDAEGCASMWRAVMRRTARDIGWLASVKPTRDNRAERNEAERYCPVGFVGSAWFDEICSYIETDAEKLRARFVEMIEMKA